MKAKAVQVQEQEQKEMLVQQSVPQRLCDLLRGTQSYPEYQIEAPVPSLTQWNNEEYRERLLTSEKEADRFKRRGMRQQLDALLRLDEYARENDIDLAEAARQLTRQERETLEKRWVSILENNRNLEIQVRSAATFFENLEEGRQALANRIHWLALGTAEAATNDGCEFLGKYLGDYADVPDPRDARGYVVASGWAGSPESRDRLNRTTHAYRSMLFTDSPRYRTIDQLEADSLEGGTLEELPGEKEHHRHCVSYGNWVRVRRAFAGRFAQEAEDVYIPPSAAVIGRQLNLIAQGRSFEVSAGWNHALLGCDRPELDLKLARDGKGFALLAKHRTNPIIARSADSERCLPWGVDTQNHGAQIGEAICEMDTARYVEWVLNKNCMFQNLDKGRDRAQAQLSAFLDANSGPDRMFKSESTVDVRTDAKKKKLIVTMDLSYQTVAESAVIKMKKNKGQQEVPAEVEIERNA